MKKQRQTQLRNTAAWMLGLAALLLACHWSGSAAASGEAAPCVAVLPDGFVNVADAVPEVLLDIRYYGSFNFVGKKIAGYHAPVAILSRPAAAALAKAAAAAGRQGYLIRVFDAYRPQKAVDHFVNWAVDLGDQRNKPGFYPEVDKSRLFKDNYIAAKSGHSRGSTLDLTLVDRRSGLELDMGTPFDFFGDKSHHGSARITKTQEENRNLLKAIMESSGFKPYPEEWWHYTLVDEPFPGTYFNFPVQ